LREAIATPPPILRSTTVNNMLQMMCEHIFSLSAAGKTFNPALAPEWLGILKIGAV